MEKSQFLPHINKVGTGRAALGAAREGKGVGSLLHGPLPARPATTLAPGAPSPGGRRPPCTARRRLGPGAAAGEGKRPPRALPGAGAARAGCRHGSGAEFLPGAFGPAAFPPAPPPPLRAARQLSPTRALTRTHAESHGHAASRTPCHAYAPCGARTHARCLFSLAPCHAHVPCHTRIDSHALSHGH